MAAKKSATAKKGATTTGPKAKAAPKARATKKAAAANGAAKPKAPKAAKATPAAKAAPAAKATAKKAAPIKLTDRQTEFLRKIRGAGVPGYKSAQKAEQRTIDALQDRKLVKRGPKDKESGLYHYQTTKAGEKFLASQEAPPSAP